MNTLGEEVDAVTDFIERKWNPITNLKEIVQTCAHQASHDFRAAFGDMEIFRLLEKRESEGRDQKTPDGNFLNHVFMTSKKVKDVALEIDGPWRFEDKARNVINRVRASHPHVINAKPKGWREFGKDYNDFDGMEEYCKNQARLDRAEFKGEIFSSRMAPPLYQDLSLPYVKYQDSGQGRSAYSTLVSVVYSHFLSYQELQNTKLIMAELESVLDELQNGRGLPEIQNIHLCLMAADYEQELVSLPEVDEETALSQDEIKEREELAKQIIDEILAEAKSYDKEFKERDGAKRERIRSELVAHFDGDGKARIGMRP